MRRTKSRLGARRQTARLSDAAGGPAADSALAGVVDVNGTLPKARHARLDLTGWHRPGMTLRKASRLSPLPHGVLQARARRSRFEWLLLTLMRRPGRQPDNVKGGTDAAVGFRKLLAIDSRHTHHGCAAGWRAPPLQKDVR